MGDVVHILLRMNLGVKCDAEYDGADRFVEKRAQSAHFGSLFGPKWAFGGILAKLMCMKSYYFFIKNSYSPLIYHSTNSSYALMKGPVTWP